MHDAVARRVDMLWTAAPSLCNRRCLHRVDRGLGHENDARLAVYSQRLRFDSTPAPAQDHDARGESKEEEEAEEELGGHVNLRQRNAFHDRLRVMKKMRRMTTPQVTAPCMKLLVAARCMASLTACAPA
jgi:hypothetical protein